MSASSDGGLRRLSRLGHRIGTTKALATWPLRVSATPTTATSVTGVAADGLFDLAGAQAVSGHVDHVVGAAQDEVVAVLVADAPVEGVVDLVAGKLFQ
jgi:hypothetical protein